MLDGDVDKEQEGDEKGRLEEAKGEDGMEFAEAGLLAEGQGTRVEVPSAEEGSPEELGEGPKGDGGDEQELDGPKGVEALQGRSGLGLEAEMEDEEEGEGGEEEECQDEREGGEV